MALFSDGNVLTAAQLNALQTVVVKSADQSVTSSTTLVNDTELALTLAANRTYYVRLVMRFTAATGGDIKLAWTTSVSPSNTPLRFQDGPDTGTTNAGATTARKTANGLSTSVPYGADGSISSAVVEEFVVVTGASGTVLTLQWAQNASSGTATTVQGSSFLMATQVA